MQSAREIIRTAEISPCGKYRWWLRRRWAPGPIVCFVMLNPSIADAQRDDPTIRRCIAFARAWGFSALSVRNLFAFRATDPKDLKKAMKSIDVTGGERGASELRAAMTADLVIAAWGANATEIAVKRFYDLTNPKPLWCLGTTLEDKPLHPLRLPKSLVPSGFFRIAGTFWADALKVEAQQCPS